MFSLSSQAFGQVMFLHILKEIEETQKLSNPNIVYKLDSYEAKVSNIDRVFIGSLHSCIKDFSIAI